MKSDWQELRGCRRVRRFASFGATDFAERRALACLDEARAEGASEVWLGVGTIFELGASTLQPSEGAVGGAGYQAPSAIRQGPHESRRRRRGTIGAGANPGTIPHARTNEVGLCDTHATPHMDSPSLPPGTHLAHYRILRRLGAGGMGEVYEAEDTKLKRRVAVKVLPAGVASDAFRRARLEKEAQAVAALNHPNIVTIYSVEESGDTRFLTMEIVDGRTLVGLDPADRFPLRTY